MTPKMMKKHFVVDEMHMAFRNVIFYLMKSIEMNISEGPGTQNDTSAGLARGPGPRTLRKHQKPLDTRC